MKFKELVRIINLRESIILNPRKSVEVRPMHEDRRRYVGDPMFQSTPITDAAFTLHLRLQTGGNNRNVVTLSPGTYYGMEHAHRSLSIKGEGRTGRRVGIERCQLDGYRGWSVTVYETFDGQRIGIVIDLKQQRIWLYVIGTPPRARITVTQTVTATHRRTFMR